MSTQLNEMGAWFFLRMREWGIGRVGRNLNLAEHQFWKNVFKFSWERKHQKRPPFPHAAGFSLPSLLGLNKIFLETQLSIHVVARKQNHYDSEPFRNFSCSAIWILHVFGFCVMIFPLFDNFILSHVFSCLLFVFLNTISLNPIWCLCFEIPAIYSFWYFCSSRSGTGNVQKFVNFCVCM